MIPMEQGVQYLIQGGAVGLAIYLAWVNYKLNSNHIEHHQRAVEMFADALKQDVQMDKELSVAIQKLTDRLT